MAQPTPYQARILRLLKDRPLVIRYHEGSNSAAILDIDGDLTYQEGDKIVREIRQELRVNRILDSTRLTLIENGWIFEVRKTEQAIEYGIADQGILAIEGLKPKEFTSTRKSNEAISTDFMVEALKQRHPRENGWLCFTEVTMTDPEDQKNTRRIDVVFFNFWRKYRWKRIAYELKRARSNFLQELREPEKRTPVMQFVNEFYFVAPKGMIESHEIPEDVGLLEVDDNGFCRIKVRAPFIANQEPTWELLATFVRLHHDNT